MTLAQSLEEQETHFNIIASNRSIVLVFSDDPVMIRRLEGVNARMVRDLGNGGKEYELDIRQLLLRKVPRVKALTDEQKQQLRERLRVARGKGNLP